MTNIMTMVELVDLMMMNGIRLWDYNQTVLKVEKNKKNLLNNN